MRGCFHTQSSMDRTDRYFDALLRENITLSERLEPLQKPLQVSEDLAMLHGNISKPMLCTLNVQCKSKIFRHAFQLTIIPESTHCIITMYWLSSSTCMKYVPSFVAQSIHRYYSQIYFLRTFLI